MTDEFYTGTWTGTYVYGRQYQDLAGEGCDFKVEITLKDGILSGSGTEEVTEKYMGAPAILSGFIDGGMISMIKQYPCWYKFDENNQVILDRSKTHQVHYTGIFDPETQRFSGEWEIEKVLEEDFFGGAYLHIWCGTWEMEKKPAG